MGLNLTKKKSNFKPLGWGYGNPFTFDGQHNIGGVVNPAVPPYLSLQRSAPAAPRRRYNTPARQFFCCNRSNYLVRNCPLNISKKDSHAAELDVAC